MILPVCVLSAIDSVTLQLVVKSLVRNFQNLKRRPHVATVGHQSLTDQVAFKPFQLFRQTFFRSVAGEDGRYAFLVDP